MKARYEQPAPESCHVCKVAIKYEAAYTGRILIVCGILRMDVSTFNGIRAPDCPLKIVPETPEGELKPCPFCGCKAVLLTEHDAEGGFENYNIRCKGCYTRIGWYSEEQHAIAAWNRRDGK